jgi:hypothetical protein
VLDGAGDGVLAVTEPLEVEEWRNMPHLDPSGSCMRTGHQMIRKSMSLTGSKGSTSVGGVPTS